MPPILRLFSVVAAGVFVFNFDNERKNYRIYVQAFQFWTVFAILLINIGLMIFIRPSAAYRVPHPTTTFQDVLTYCYASKILDEEYRDGKPVFLTQDQHEGREHMVTRIILHNKKFVFGMYLGAEGKRHLGFDVDERDEDGRTVVVTRFDPGTNRFGIRRR